MMLRIAVSPNGMSRRRCKEFVFYCLTIPLYINPHPSRPQGYNLWDIETQSDAWKCSMLGFDISMQMLCRWILYIGFLYRNSKGVIGLNDLNMEMYASLDAHCGIGDIDKFVLLCVNVIRIDIGIFSIVL